MTFQATYKRIFGNPPPPVTNPQLLHYWDEPVSRLCELQRWTGDEPSKERHQIYTQLLMAIVYHYWNGYKAGRPNKPDQYPWNDVPSATDPPALRGDYYGHNIAALAVDNAGYVLDFDFNHNTLFNSSAEHAEARLVRRLYSLAQISDSWGALPTKPAGSPTRKGLTGAGAAARGIVRRRQAAEHLGNEASEDGEDRARVKYASLKHVTVYTSLESCSQCSGVMALAQVREVVYLQTDPGTFFIGRILHNLMTGRSSAPRPISGSEIDLACFGELDEKYERFTREVGRKPFWISDDGRQDVEPSITSFLCTGAARSIFRDWGKLPDDGSLKHGAFMPSGQALSNAGVLSEARDFLQYATTSGLRGTPHNL